VETEWIGILEREKVRVVGREGITLVGGVWIGGKRDINFCLQPGGFGVFLGSFPIKYLTQGKEWK
jgi:hypothetical protein